MLKEPFQPFSSLLASKSNPKLHLRTVCWQHKEMCQDTPKKKIATTPNTNPQTLISMIPSSGKRMTWTVGAELVVIHDSAPALAMYTCRTVHPHKSNPLRRTPHYQHSGFYNQSSATLESAGTIRATQGPAPRGSAWQSPAF